MQKGLLTAVMMMLGATAVQAEDIAFGTHISSSSPQADSVRHTINNTAGYAIVYANFEKERESEIHYKEPVEFNVEAWDVNTGSAAKNSVKEKSPSEQAPDRIGAHSEGLFERGK